MSLNRDSKRTVEHYVKEYYFNNILDCVYDAVDKTVDSIKGDIFQAVIKGLPLEQSMMLTKAAAAATGKSEGGKRRRGGGARCRSKPRLQRQDAMVPPDISPDGPVVTEGALEALRQGGAQMAGKRKRKADVGGSSEEPQGGFSKKKTAMASEGEKNGGEATASQSMPELY